MKKLTRHLRTAEHAPDLIDPPAFVARVSKSNGNSESMFTKPKKRGARAA